jgi:hypothetical protein
VKINKHDYIKPRNFCTGKKTTIIGMKRQPVEWEKISANYSFDRRSFPEHRRNSKNSTAKPSFKLGTSCTQKKACNGQQG